MDAKSKVYPWDLPHPYHESEEFLRARREGPTAEFEDDEVDDCDGWEIVCPDGRVRDYPYSNRGDAEAEADAMTSERCQLWDEPSEIETSQPPCPEGRHSVRAINPRGALVRIN